VGTWAWQSRTRSAGRSVTPLRGDERANLNAFGIPDVSSLLPQYPCEILIRFVVVDYLLPIRCCRYLLPILLILYIRVLSFLCGNVCPIWKYFHAASKWRRGRSIIAATRWLRYRGRSRLRCLVVHTLSRPYLPEFEKLHAPAVKFGCDMENLGYLPIPEFARIASRNTLILSFRLSDCLWYTVHVLHF